MSSPWYDTELAHKAEMDTNAQARLDDATARITVLEDMATLAKVPNAVLAGTYDTDKPINTWITYFEKNTNSSGQFSSDLPDGVFCVVGWKPQCRAQLTLMPVYFTLTACSLTSYTVLSRYTQPPSGQSYMDWAKSKPIGICLAFFLQMTEQ